MFGRKKSDPEAAQEAERLRVLHEIENGHPIEPRHSPPLNFGGPMLSEAEKHALELADGFGVRFNKAIRWSAFRIVEIADTFQRVGGDGLCYARNFHVYFNGLLTGQMSLCANAKLLSEEFESMSIWLELENVCLLPFDDVEGLLRSVEFATVDEGEPDVDREKRKLAISRALVRVLWDGQRKGDHSPSFRYCATGSGNWILAK